MKDISRTSSILLLSVAACAAGDEAPTAEGEGQPPSETAVMVLSESLAPFGGGYPVSGDPCRRLGESPATSPYLDDSTFLIGCPSEDTAAEVPGEIVGRVEGAVLLAVPAHNVGAALEDRQPAYGYGDAADPETGYNATAELPCGFAGASATGSCPAGVKRNWGEDGTTLVEITKPDGMKRALYFRGTEPYGADSAEADGSSSWDFSVAREGDRVTITFGPETYVVVDAFIEGG